MIYIFTDLYQSSRPSKNAYVVTGVIDYVKARQEIRSALDEQRNLTLYITDIVVAQWMSDLQRYSPLVLTWHELRPESTFERLFGMRPSELFNADLLSALALDTLVPPPPGSQAEPVSTILGQRLGLVWAYSEPPTGQFERVIQWAAEQRNWSPGPLAELLTYQLGRWITVDSRFAALKADTLPTDARHVLIRSALAGYQEAWLHTQIWDEAPTIVLTGVESIVITALRPLHRSIATYWNECYAHANESSEMINVALVQMSGLSQAEFDGLAWMVEQHPEQLTSTLLTRIERRFTALAEAQEQLAHLRRLVAPLIPALPEEDWSDTRWLHWATHEYMPYFGWVLRANQVRDHQIACAERFADWVYCRYPHWLNDDNAPLARRQHSQLRTLLDHDPNTVVLWVVLDGMAWWHSDILISLCEQHGLYIQEHEPAIAALPSITRIAKRALVTGMSTTDIDQPTIFAAASAHFVRIRVPAYITYHMRKGLDALRTDDSRCVMVLDNTIDELAHQRREFTDTLGIRGHLAEVATAIGQARDICMQQGRRLHILIGSDHGGTLLPDNASVLPLPRSVKPVEEIWEDEIAHADAQKHSARAAVIEDITHIPPEEGERWYVLDRNQFQLERHYLAPRGYHYLKPRPVGWTHGGLSPEELLVPRLHLAPEMPQIEPLQLAIDGSIRPRQESILKITFLNSNRFPLERITLAINDAEYTHLDLIDAVASESLEILFPAVTTQSTKFTLSWRIEYTVFGVFYVQQGQDVLNVRQLSVDASDFNDIFGDM